MSTFVMTEAEEKSIDSKIEPMMDWAKNNEAQAEQLAMDSARLLSVTDERLNILSKQGFFKRCWSRFTGETGKLERITTSDLIQMQKMAFSYINMLQEQSVLMAHSMLALKNNLLSLAVNEEETRNLVALLAQKTLQRFEQLESRVDKLEISANLQGWLLSLEERDYVEKIPTEYMRVFRVISDFYSIKNDFWNSNDIMFMRKAIRIVGINPKKRLSINTFINELVDEIQCDQVGFESYKQAITLYNKKTTESYSKFAVENISSPVFTTMHALNIQYMDRLDIVEELQNEMNISIAEALKRLLRRSIASLNVNLDYEIPLSEAAIEILGCLRLVNKLQTTHYRESSEKSIEQKNDGLNTEKLAIEDKLETIDKNILSIIDSHIKYIDEFDIVYTYQSSDDKIFRNTIDIFNRQSSHSIEKNNCLVCTCDNRRFLMLTKYCIYTTGENDKIYYIPYNKIHSAINNINSIKIDIDNKSIHIRSYSEKSSKIITDILNDISCFIRKEKEEFNDYISFLSNKYDLPNCDTYIC